MTRWDGRYRPDRYFYGTDPSAFVARALDGVPPGRALFLAEGEGRNAVHAARLGHDVVALDGSREGRRKALALAAEHGVALTYHVADVRDVPFEEERWDVIVLCYFHMPADLRVAVHRRVAAALRPGGRLVVQAFTRAQHGRPSGGPPDPDLLYDLDELRHEFPGVRWQLAREHEVELDEGVGHRGLAAVLELIGIREDTCGT